MTAPPRMVTAVSEGGVPGELLGLAARLLPVLVAGLGLPADTRIAWFRPESKVAEQLRRAGTIVRARQPIPGADDGVAGFVNPTAHTVLWLRADAESEDLIETISHEAKHSQFVGRVLAGLDTDRDDEPEAKAFGEQIAAAWKRGAMKGVMEMLFKTSAPSGLTYKSTPFRALDLKASGSGWQVSGYASTFGDPPDVYGDVIQEGAFARTIQERRTKLLLEHHTLIGFQLDLKEDHHGLLGTWAIIDTTDGVDAHKLLLGGALDAMSIGYFTRDSELRSDGVRVLKDIDLFECSLVGVPANPRAVVTGAKHGAGRPGAVRINLSAELQRRRLAAVKRNLQRRGVTV